MSSVVTPICAGAAELVERDGFSAGKIEICAGVSGDLHVAGKGSGACAQRDRTLAAGVAGDRAGAEVGGRAVLRQRDRAALVVLGFRREWRCSAAPSSLCRRPRRCPHRYSPEMIPP